MLKLVLLFDDEYTLIARLNVKRTGMLVMWLAGGFSGARMRSDGEEKRCWRLGSCCGELISFSVLNSF
jgi:hypothetical protein